MNITNLKNRAGLACALALALLGATSLAEAGTYSAQLVGYSGTPTITGVASSSLSGLTTSWDITDGYNLTYGSQHRYSRALGTGRWKITWTAAYVGDPAPGQCAVLFAKQLAQYSYAETYCMTPGQNAWSAEAISSDTMNAVLTATSQLGANTYQEDGENYQELGSKTPTHRGYLDTTGSQTTNFGDDGAGHWVAYTNADFSAYTDVTSQGGAKAPAPANQPVGSASSSAIVHGKHRLIFVNGVQIGNDFPGGQYATSGYSN